MLCIPSHLRSCLLSFPFSETRFVWNFGAKRLGQRLCTNKLSVNHLLMKRAQCATHPAKRQSTGIAHHSSLPPEKQMDQMPAKMECSEETNATSGISKPIITSLNDYKKYRALQLKNGLQVLLISDIKPQTHAKTEGVAQTSEKQSAAALSIGAGCFEDPDDIPGLSHFLEHMVFMGSEKYPDENEFDVYIKNHGGSSNAYTDCEKTVFYFDVKQENFQKGLDIFSQFFIHPLLKKDSVDREMKAVDNEFSQGLQSDGQRTEMIMATMAKKGHPLSRFMCGNLKTLKEIPEKDGIDIYARLQALLKHQYTAQCMTLCVQARETLDQLEQWVSDSFNATPNNGRLPHTYSEPHLADPYDTPAFRKLYKMVPVNNSHEIDITWILPCLLPHYRSRPDCYISWLVGHEGAGSVLSLLKKRLWATQMAAGVDSTDLDHNSMCAVFGVNITLTELGFQHIPEVIKVVFEYIEMLKHQGPSERIYTEIKTIAENDFRWMEQLEPIDNVEIRCEKMSKYSMEDWLTGGRLYMQYDPQMISECLKLMNPDRTNILLSSPNYSQGDQCDLTEPWFTTKYSVQDVPQSWTDSWKGLKPNDDLHLPPPNTFIADNFDIIEPDSPNTELPIALINREDSRLWYKMDTKFKMPKAYVKFILRSFSFKESVMSLCMFDLFLRVLYQNLAEMAYAAEMADLSYSVGSSDNAMTISVSGFNDKLKRLFEDVVRHIVQFEVTEAQCESMKQQQAKSLHNTYIKPGSLNTEVRLSILKQNQMTSVELQRCVPGVTRDGLLQFVRSMLTNVHVEGLIQGNITAQDAKWYEAHLQEQIKGKRLPFTQVPQDRVVQLAPGQTTCRIQNLNAADAQSNITNYYQYGPGGCHKLVLNSMLLYRMEEPVFDILRTREQLGYTVYSSNRLTDGITGFSISVISQAAKHSLDELDDHIEKFLVEFSDILGKMTVEEFDTLKTTLIKLRLTEDSALDAEFSRNWNEITDMTYVFDRLEKEVEELKSITLEDLTNWYRDYSTGAYRKLSIQIQGKEEAPELGKEEGEAKDAAGNSGDEEEVEEEDIEDEESGDSDEEMDTNVPLDMEAMASVCLTFLPVESKEKTGELCVINDISAFKSGSTFYPVSRPI